MPRRPMTLIRTLTVACGLFAIIAATGPAQDPPADSNVEVLTRGPIHEAYASAVDVQPQAGILVPKQPPDLIEELPPDQKPEGDNVQWMPGYWSWDDDRKDFIWVSGFWRVPPPDRVWVPGNWHQVNNQWQWTSGFWNVASQPEVQYSPPPPPPIESGPSTPAPG